MIFRSDGTVHPGPRNDYHLNAKPLLGTGSDVQVGDGLLQFGEWRLGEVTPGTGTSGHFSLAHSSLGTAMIWRSDGTQHPGPRSDWHTWGHALTAGNVFVGNNFVQIGQWRLGDFDGTHMSIYAADTGKTAVIYRSDGTIHPGPRTDYQNKNSKTHFSSCSPRGPCFPDRVRWILLEKGRLILQNAMQQENRV